MWFEFCNKIVKVRKALRRMVHSRANRSCKDLIAQKPFLTSVEIGHSFQTDYSLFKITTLVNFKESYLLNGKPKSERAIRAALKVSDSFCLLFGSYRLHS